MSTDWNPKSCQRTSLPHARFPSPLHHSTSQQLVWLQLPSTSFSAVSSQAPASMVFAISSAWSLLTFTWAALYFPNVIGSWRFMDPRHTHTPQGCNPFLNLCHSNCQYCILHDPSWQRVPWYYSGSCGHFMGSASSCCTLSGN